MLTVTETAKGHLASLLAQSEAPSEAVVRFVPQGQGLAMQIGTEQPGDTTFEHEEKTVLALEAPVAEALADKTLDLQSSEQGPQLTITE